MDENTVKTANDLISDSIDAFYSGDKELAGQYIHDAIGQKISDRMKECLVGQID